MMNRILAFTILILTCGCALLAAGQTDQRVQATGTVIRVDAQYNEISLCLLEGECIVVVRPETKILRYIYPAEIGSIREGDVLGVTGTVTGGKIYADRIQISKEGKGLPASYRDREAVVEGTITFPAAQFDRTFAMNTAYGERKVDVGKSAVVTRGGRGISVHDLAKGDIVRAGGTWDGSRLDCARVEVVDVLTPFANDGGGSEIHPQPSAPPPTNNPPGPVAAPSVQPEQPPVEPSAQPEQPSNVRTGRIVAIDHAKLTMTIDSAMTDTKIDAPNATVTRKESTRRFGDLKKGDKVTVTGELVDGVVKATAIEIVD